MDPSSNETISVRIAHYEAQSEAIAIFADAMLAIHQAAQFQISQGKEINPFNLALLVADVNNDLDKLGADLFE